ncbi:hypothetical protein [Serratia marcescens]|nr:hypothetical protein [Serratia marcescens]
MGYLLNDGHKKGRFRDLFREGIISPISGTFNIIDLLRTTRSALDANAG